MDLRSSTAESMDPRLREGDASLMRMRDMVAPIDWNITR